MTGAETATGVASGARGSVERVGALVSRYYFLLRGSWPRMLELAYWPVVQMVMWGFMTVFLATKTSYVAHAFGVLISAVMLWDALFRSQISVSLSFMEEMWSRNLGQLFMSPLRPAEMMAGLLTISALRTLIGVIPATLLAIVFFDYSIYEGLGIPLVGFFAALLVMGWAIGLAVAGLVLRFGLGAESLAWVSVFALAPVSGIWYPISILPGWLQPVSLMLPSAHVFEGMRSILIDAEFQPASMAAAFGLDAIYLALGAACFRHCFELARRDGQLLQSGE